MAKPKQEMSHQKTTGNKKPYTTPKLERHGSVVQLTERGSGSGDATKGRKVS